MDEHTKTLTKLCKTIYKCELHNLTPNQLRELEEHLIAQKNIKNMDTMDKVELMIQAMANLKAEKDIKEFK